MSIQGVGAYGSAGIDQVLAKMLSRLDRTKSTTSDTSSTSATSNTASVSAAPASTPGAPLTGTSQPTLADSLMALLVQMQQHSAADGTQAGSSSPATPATQAPQAGDPTQQLFAAMDANGDGSLSEGDMESYVEGKGGSKAQADALFSSLSQNASGQNASTGITGQQLAGDVSQAQPAGHHHHHPHGGAGMGPAASNSTSDAASQMFSALDSNKDGTLSADEFSTALSAGKPTSTTNTSAIDPSALFAKADGNSDGSVTTGELGNFLTSLANQAQSDFTTLGAFGQIAAQSYNASVSLLNVPGSGQSSYA